MISRIYTQKLDWLDLDNRIVNETTTIEWKLFGKITFRKRVVTVTNVVPNKEKPVTGFKRNE